MITPNQIYLGNCLELMKDIQDGTIDLIVTDPPYRITPRGTKGSMGGYWTDKIVQKGLIFDHNDIDIEDYINEFYRVLKPDAHCYIMCNNLNLPHFFDVISKSDFKFVKLLVWDKQSKICGRYYMGQVEHIFMLRKGKDKAINDCGCSDLLSFSNFNREKDNNGNNLHNSIKPVALFQCLIENSSNVGETVLDPFCGSGTLAVACINSKRKYICFEIDDNYYNVAKQRVEKTKNSPNLFTI